MTESMTGFGEGKATGSTLEIEVSARSVNHRYLDLSVRMPEFLRRHEQQLSNLVRKEIRRGRVEIRVDVKPVGEEIREVELRQGVVEAYERAIAEARAKGLLAGAVSAGELLRLPEVVGVSVETPESVEEDIEALLAATQRAVGGLRTARRAEGERLERSIDDLVVLLAAEVGSLDAIRDQLREEMGARLQERLEQVLGGTELDPDRLVMEVALLAERSDVQEEIDRLTAHLEAFRSLTKSEDLVGKKFDFLCQEILRELNTIGSKCRDSRAVAHVLEGKVVCEQLREQVQNIQ